MVGGNHTLSLAQPNKPKQENIISSDGHTFVYSLLRYRYRYIISNGRY
jgi:hypothetical protein